MDKQKDLQKDNKMAPATEGDDMTELSWPIEKIERGSQPDTWNVWLKGEPSFVTWDEEVLVAAGIPAEPYPAPPVTVTVTVGDRSEVVELTEQNIDIAFKLKTIDPESTGGKVGAALRRLGVQP